MCLIDSVGSQANRMEPIFRREQYRNLVPRVTIIAKLGGNETSVNLLEAGHRAADAIVRFSNLATEFEGAFRAIRSSGDAEPLSKLAPTSLVFGVWDSRATQVKLPRIVRSVIRAHNVKTLHRSAQYVPPMDYVTEGILDEPQDKSAKDALSELGLQHAPASWSHGGVLAQGDIRREASLNLAALRGLKAGSDDRTLALRRYILGIALVAFTAPQETSLREGCQLVPDAQRPATWQIVHHDGKRSGFVISHAEALAYAQAAATAFGVGPEKTATFDSAKAKAVATQSKEERKRSRRASSSNASETES